MSDNMTSRRSILKSSAAMATLGVGGSLSGCSGLPFGGGGNGSASPDERISKVPEGATFVMHVSASAMLSDDVVRDRANQLLQDSASAGDPQSLDEAFSQAESELGFDPSDVTEMLAFGNSANDSAGSILWTEWEQSAVTSALTDNGFSEGSYGGKTVFTPSSAMAGETRIARLEETTYAFGGTQQSINAIIDTWTGDGSAASGDVETAYTAAEGGYVQFGFDIPPEQLPSDGQSGGQGMQAVNNIEYGHGSVTDADNGRELVLELETSDEESAQGLRGLIDVGLGTVEQQLQQAAQQPGADTENIQQFLDALSNVETSQDGTTVTIRNSDGITFAIGALAVAATFALGFSGGTAGQ